MSATPKTPVVISTRTVGVHFGTEGLVRRLRGRRVIHTTRVFPHGFTANAYDAAKAWAIEHGYVLYEAEP